MLPCCTNAPYTTQMALCRELEMLEACWWWGGWGGFWFRRDWIRASRKMSTPTTGMAAAMQAHTARSKGAKSEKMLIFSSGLRRRMPTE